METQFAFFPLLVLPQPVPFLATYFPSPFSTFKPGVDNSSKFCPFSALLASKFLGKKLSQAFSKVFLLVHMGEVTLNFKEFNSSTVWGNKTFLICWVANEGPLLVKLRLFQNASKSEGHADLLSPENHLSSVAWALESKAWVENLALEFSSWSWAVDLCLFFLKKEYTRVALRFSER